MTLNQFKWVRIGVAFFLAIGISQAILFEKFSWAVAGMAVAAAVLFVLRKKVKGVLADERDYEVGGKAARAAIAIFSWIAVLMMFYFMAYKNTNPSYEAIAMTLAYSVCAVLFIYTGAFYYYGKISFKDHKIAATVALIFLLLVFATLAMRLLSGEDSWVCKDGQWIKHGVPSAPTPTAECK